MTNLCTPTMASAGAIVLKSQPWSGEAADPRRVAEQVWDAMERQRIEDGVALRNEATAARLAHNTPWNTPANTSEHKRDLADRSARRLVSP